MRKIYAVGVVLTAVSAFGAIMAQGASAELTFEIALWLIKAEVPANGTLVLGEGEVLVEDSKLGIAVDCSGHAQGETEEEGNSILVIDILNLAGTQEFSAGKELTTEGMLCKSVNGCAENADMEIFPLNFPWLLEAMLDIQDKTPWILMVQYTGAPGPAGWEVKCLILGVATEEACSGENGTGAEAKNLATGVELVEKAEEPNLNCTVGGAGGGVVVPIVGNLISSGSGLVAISTPPE